MTSPDVLYRDWHAEEERSHAYELMSALPKDAKVVTVLDGFPTTLTWLGYVLGPLPPFSFCVLIPGLGDCVLGEETCDAWGNSHDCGWV